MSNTSYSEQLNAFNRSRKVPSPRHLCYAPFLSLNFDQSGSITACCFNRTHVLGTFPDQSVAEAWNDLPIQELRKAMADFNPGLGCQQCTKMIEENNFESVLISHFDEYLHLAEAKKSKNAWWTFGLNSTKTDINQVSAAPTVFEFEISNHCNLECIMCGGKWSSAIRKNREGLPPLKSPYNEAFTKQIKAYLPTLKRANFLGGEPLLISLYYTIWEDIIEVNPSIDVAITSNGTILNDRAKKIIQKLPNCRITLSIDSLKKGTWESIRLNGDFDVLKQNIDWLKESGKLRSFSVCPMIQNWQEIPEIIQYCQDNKLDIFFNVVYGPLGGRKEGIHAHEASIHASTTSAMTPEVSMSRLSKAELQEIVLYYRTFQFEKQWQIQFDNLISQLVHWEQEKV